MTQTSEKNWGAVRAATLSELVFWRNQKTDASKRFIAQKEPKPSILFDKNFLDSQIAWGKVSALEAQLKDFDQAHGFEGFPV